MGAVMAQPGPANQATPDFFGKMGRQFLEEDDFLSRKYDEREMFLTPWLKAGSLNMVWANRGIGKTWFCLSLGMAITRGAALGAWDTVKPVNCLYIDGEMSAIDLQSRLKMLAYGLGVPKQASFNILSCERMQLEEGARVNLSEEACREDLLRHLEKGNFQVVMIDNISSLTPGIDENDKSAWDPVNQWLLKIRALGVAVILVHHAGKGDTQRGTSGREDNLDTVIHLSAGSGKLSDGAKFKVAFTKARSVCGMAAEPFTMAIKESGGKLTWTTSINQASKYAAILQMLSDGGTSQKRIAELVGCTPQYVSDSKKEAIAKGWLTDECQFTPEGKKRYGKLDLPE